MTEKLCVKMLLQAKRRKKTFELEEVETDAQDESMEIRTYILQQSMPQSLHC
jgi:hypothetical protein